MITSEITNKSIILSDFLLFTTDTTIYKEILSVILTFVWLPSVAKAHSQFRKAPKNHLRHTRGPLATHNEGRALDIMQFFIALSLYPQVKKHCLYTRVHFNY